MRRFWDSVQVVHEGEFYVIRLDGRPMRLPGGPLLALRCRALAHAIAAEWQAAGGGQGGLLSVEDMPLTRIAGTAQERVAPDPGSTVAALMRYAEADLLCYRVETPTHLVRRQTAEWQPWLDWLCNRYGADLQVTTGLSRVAQPEAALAAVAHTLAERPTFELAGLGILVPSLGSVVLGLAVADGKLHPGEAHRIAILEELFQAEKWGDDREALARRHAVGQDILAAARFMALSRPSEEALG